MVRLRSTSTRTILAVATVAVLSSIATVVSVWLLVI